MLECGVTRGNLNCSRPCAGLGDSKGSREERYLSNVSARPLKRIGGDKDGGTLMQTAEQELH